MKETVHFSDTRQFDTDTLGRLIDAAFDFKSGAGRHASLAGRSVALVFFNPSLRTRASMQVAVYELGGNAVILEPGSSTWSLEHREDIVMDGDKTEHIKEFVRVLERYVSAIGVRTFAALQDWSKERTDPVLQAFIRYSNVPIINLESAMHHPCQAMADMMTIQHHFGKARKKIVLTWAWHPKALPMAVPNSFAMAAAQFGHDLVIAHPKGYDLDAELIGDARVAAADAGGTVTVTDSTEEAFTDADVVYAKSWGSSRFYGDQESEIVHRGPLRGHWIVDRSKMHLTNNAIFMHCLPVRRNVVVTDEILDSPSSVVIDEAENRLHVQKAILAHILK